MLKFLQKKFTALLIEDADRFFCIKKFLGELLKWRYRVFESCLFLEKFL